MKSVIQPPSGKNKPVFRAGSSRFEAQAVAAEKAVHTGVLPMPLDRTRAGPRSPDIGTGRPLDGILRAKAEEAFNADLSAVRIHDGTGGRRARQLAVPAFTAGSDIHVADRNVLAGQQGYPLLFHEIAHVLQQTGERGPDGRMHATRRYGSGPVYGVGGPLEGENAPERADLVDKLVAVHRTGDGGAEDADLEAVIGRVEGGFDTEGADGTALATEVIDGAIAGISKPLHQMSRRARGLLFDLVKFGGHNQAAATLLTGDIDLPSAAKHEPFLTYIGTNAAVRNAIHSRIFAERRRLRQFVTIAYPQAVWNYLMDLERQPQAIYGFEAYVEELFAEIFDWDVLGRNDAFFQGVSILQIIDEDYHNTIQKGRREGQHFSGDKLRFKSFMASGIEAWAGARSAEFDGLEGFGFLADAHMEVAELARRALVFWQTAQERGAGTYRSAIEQAEEGGVFPESPIVETARTHIQRAGLSLLATTQEGELLSGRAYRARRNSFRRAIQDLIRLFDTHLRTQVSKDADDFNDMNIVAGALRLLIPGLIDTLDFHSDSTASTDEVDRVQDIRVASRIRIARELSRYGRMLNAPVLSERTAAVLSGRDIRRSSLALLSAWEKDSSVAVADMAHEISTHREDGSAHTPISFSVGEGDEARKVFLPLTVSDLVAIYRLMYSQRLANALSGMLSASDPLADGEQRSIIQRAYTAARGDDRPMRWKVQTFEFIGYEGDPRSFRQILTEHDATKHEMAAQSGSFGAVLYPDAFHDAIFAWVIPSLDPLVTILRRVDLLNGMIERAGFVSVESLNNSDWIQALAHTAEQGENLGSILGAVTVTLGTLQDTEDERLEELLPLAVSYERRRSLQDIRAQLQLYVDDSLMNYSAPNEAQSAIGDFRRLVMPDAITDMHGRPYDHANAQTAILMLQLSDDLQRAFSPQVISGWDAAGRHSEARFDIVSGFTPFLRLALRTSVPGRSHQLTQLMNEAEIAGIDNSLARRGLRRLLRQFEETAREQAELLALISDGTTLKSNLFSSEIAVSAEPFTANGYSVQIMRIFRPFVFLPAYGRGDEQVTPPTLLDARRQVLEPSGQTLIRIKINNGDSIDITDSLSGIDLELLMFLNNVIANRAFQLSMEGIGEGIEFAAELTLDAAEFIPGAGQALMVARIVYEVTQFLMSDEFDDMLAVVRGQPVEELIALGERLATDLFDTDTIWQFLLFNGSAIDYLREERRDPRRERVARRGRRGSKFSRIARSIGRIPIHFYDRLNAVRARTVPRVRNIQTFVASRPRVAFGLEVASGIASGVPVFGIDINNLDDVFAAMDDPQASLDAKLTEMLSAIDQFELPDAPIPNDLIIAAMIEFILERLKRMGKIGKAIRLLLPILRMTGAIDEIGQLIASAMAGSAVDPNLYWQRELKPQVADAFTRAKRDFVTTANNELRQFGLAGLPEPGEIGFHQTPLPEMSPDVSPKLDPTARHNPNAGIDPGPLGPGAPLSAPTTRRVSREFGHDLSHVRLHSGTDAARLTGRFGALGLTSGSHVFLKPGLSPDRGEGQRVMRHELAHVLQHTGPSPLGRTAGKQPQPQMGKPGKGLRYDRSSERAADHAAEIAAGPGHRVGKPIQAGGRSSGGLSPALGGRLFADILNRLTEPADIDAFVNGVLERSQPGRTATAPGMADAQRIWTQTKAALSDSRKGRFRSHANATGIPALIRSHINSGRGAEITSRMIAVLASQAQRPAHVRSGASAGTPSTELNPGAFANVLESFVFAFTGVAMSIRLNTSGSRPEVTRVSVYLIDLGRIPSETNALWVKAIADTPRTRGLSVQDKNLLFRITRFRKPSEKILQSRDFQFDNGYLDRFETIKRETAGITVVPWQEYTDVDAENPGTGTEHRLRLGSHGQLTGIGTADRESHHIPQFVLIEYFRNEAATRMFDDPRDRLPGFEDSDNPATFADGTNSINLAALHTGSGRGGGMPAILLAARTHKMGKLHIGGSGSWTNQNDFGTPPRTQSDQVATRFRRSALRHLRARGAPSGGTGDTDFRRVADWANTVTRRTMAKPAVFEAMRDTYHWMYRDVMRPSLSRALRTEEPKFYTSAALQARGSAATTLDAAHDPTQGADRSGAVMSEVDQMQRSARYEIRNFRPEV